MKYLNGIGWVPDEAELKRMSEKYKAGTRVELIEMDDPKALPPGTKGTVTGVDDIGSIMVNWDNGSSLSVVYGADKCKTVENQEKGEENGKL